MLSRNQQITTREGIYCKAHADRLPTYLRRLCETRNLKATGSEDQ